jgi:hypothetical protein
MTGDTRTSIAWLVVFGVVLFMMEIFGPKVGIAIIAAELANMSWRMRDG